MRIEAMSDEYYPQDISETYPLTPPPMTTTNNLYVLRSEIEKVFIQMIFDANASMYPECKVLEMKEFNMFSCGKASIEIAKDRVMKIPTINPLDTTIAEIDKMIDSMRESYHINAYDDWKVFDFADELKKTLSHKL